VWRTCHGFPWHRHGSVQLQRATVGIRCVSLDYILMYTAQKISSRYCIGLIVERCHLPGHSMVFHISALKYFHIFSNMCYVHGLSLLYFQRNCSLLNLQRPFNTSLQLSLPAGRLISSSNLSLTETSAYRDIEPYLGLDLMCLALSTLVLARRKRRAEILPKAYHMLI
jgi:hypothetical protein